MHAEVRGRKVIVKLYDESKEERVKKVGTQRPVSIIFADCSFQRWTHYVNTLKRLLYVKYSSRITQYTHYSLMKATPTSRNSLAFRMRRLQHHLFSSQKVSPERRHRLSSLIMASFVQSNCVIPMNFYGAPCSQKAA